MRQALLSGALVSASPSRDSINKGVCNPITTISYALTTNCPGRLYRGLSNLHLQPLLIDILLHGVGSLLEVNPSYSTAKLLQYASAARENPIFLQRACLALFTRNKVNHLYWRS